MRQRNRIIVNGLAASSALLCLIVVILWARCRTGDDVFSRVFHGKRYTLLSSVGSIGLYCPPPPARDPKVRQAAADIVAELANDQVKWVGWLAHEKPEMDSIDYPEPYRNSAAERALDNFAPADLINPLLTALEDSRRLTVVHLLLQAPLKPHGFQRSLEGLPIDGPPLGRCVGQADGQPYPPAEQVTGSEVSFAGLTVKLNRWVAPNEFVSGRFTSLGEWIHEMAGDPDITQLPRIRERWHRTFDLPLMVVRDWQAALILGVLPLSTLSFAIRSRKQRRTRRQRGLCPACGYDVRASGDRCPECGVEIALARSSASTLLTSSSTARPSSS